VVGVTIYGRTLYICTVESRKSVRRLRVGLFLDTVLTLPTRFHWLPGNHMVRKRQTIKLAQQTAQMNMFSILNFWCIHLKKEQLNVEDANTLI